MNLVQIIFSPTGGTQKAADIFTAEWNGPAKTIDLTSPQEDFSQIVLSPDDLALIALPCYEGRVPALAAGRLAQIKGAGARCALLCVFGNRAFDDALAEMQDLAQKAGFQPIAAAAAVAEHSIFRQYGAGRPDDQDAEQLRSFSKKIMEKFQSAQSPAPLSLPGNRPYRQANGMPIAPKTAAGCSRCGLCAQQCPAQAIDKTTLKTDKDHCILCMRCIDHCPSQARKVNGLLYAAANAAMKSRLSGRKENRLFL
ncbi:MAG: 4Fe-4S binding protein [Clostridiaceae bacterium]|jgi:ferredoxin|nr:4Fe-4S binding protein [Clostridiaceae bacterium]